MVLAPEYLRRTALATKERLGHGHRHDRARRGRGGAHAQDVPWWLVPSAEGIRVPRPFCFRTIAGKPAASIFKPTGIPMHEIEEVVMTLDEFEALRQAD